MIETSQVTERDAPASKRWPRRRVIQSCQAERGPLLTRYFLIHTKRIAVFLHHLHASDEDRALHDHPWSFVSFLFHRGYWEHVSDRFVVKLTPYGLKVLDRAVSAAEMPSLERYYLSDYDANRAARALNMSRDNKGYTRRVWRRRFSILWRPAEFQHRLELDRDRPTWTLVFRFKRRREWGFFTPGRGWQHWIAYGKEWCD